MPGANLNNITAPDQYTERAVVRAPGARHLFISVSNQAIYYQVGHGPGGGGVTWDEEEVFRLPSLYNIDVACDAVRIRAAVPAADLPAPLQPAQVTVSLS